MNLDLFSTLAAAPMHVHRDADGLQATRIEHLADIYRRCTGNHHTSQLARMALALQELGSVSTYECRQFLDIYCPPARKFDLVQQGCRIETHWQSIESDCGQIHRVGLYVLR